ncbi:MAG: bifunctional aspartate kinase/homoserine dehydrogenase I [Ferruginibacter sp.]
MQVLKFGGSSVANAENIKKVIAVVQQKAATGNTIVVVSALGGITDLLLHCSEMASTGDEAYKQKLLDAELRHLNTVKELVPLARQSSVLSFVKTQCNEIEDICNGIFLLRELSARSKDRILSYGELLSSKIISTAMNALGIDNTWLDSRELIITNSNFGNAQVDLISSNNKINYYLQANPSKLYIAPGFIASNAQHIATTLGRGGSDYTAAIYAAAVNASSLEIWTDVSGMMTADPRLVQNAKIIPQISYQEAMELSHFGAKIIYPPTIQPVMDKGIPVWVKNTFAPADAGTLIEQHSQTQAGSTVTGISSINKIALISLEGSGMVGIPGFSKRLFEALASKKINVILITQSSSEHSICAGINEDDAAAAKETVDEAFANEIEAKKVEPLFVETGLAIVALVGDRMKNHTGISGKLFHALGRNGVNIRAISQGSSERNISTVINNADVKKASNIIHEAFFEEEIKEVNLFLAGIGNVGSKLLAQIKKQQPYLREKLRIRLKVTGIANSKQFLIDEEGIELENRETIFNNAVTGNTDAYIEAIKQKNLRNSVFADVTASNTAAELYDRLLEKSIAVVACNKVACSSGYDYYRKLKNLATEYNAPFLFETNVGAGLPIIGTLNDLVKSGDTIQKMQAVLSGTLNFVFNNYDGSRPFADVVKQAQDEGYTEPDPRLDLGGKDVMRKIMILAREAGRQIEMDDISNNSFMPDECMQGSVEDFYTSMKKHEAHFKKILDDANAAGSKLKFVASYNEEKAAVGLQHINPQHDFYHLYGKDNIVLFYTNRYPEQPLVVKGAGAGADVTASGVFADILRAAKS